ncbi:replication initiator [Streptomyces malaysiensis]|uniref:replication initiator n=1 Tax=Streptomyces malaysiensis TaxID=92644 RepID=UPI0032D56A1F
MNCTSAPTVRTRLPRSVRLSFFKIAEQQERGAVHFHIVIRIGGTGGDSLPSGLGHGRAADRSPCVPLRPGRCRAGRRQSGVHLHLRWPTRARPPGAPPSTAGHELTVRSR